MALTVPGADALLPSKARRTVASFASSLLLPVCPYHLSIALILMLIYRVRVRSRCRPDPRPRRMARTLRFSTLTLNRRTTVILSRGNACLLLHGPLKLRRRFVNLLPLASGLLTLPLARPWIQHFCRCNSGTRNSHRPRQHPVSIPVSSQYYAYPSPAPTHGYPVPFTAFAYSFSAASISSRHLLRSDWE